jgi:transketolase
MTAFLISTQQVEQLNAARLLNLGEMAAIHRINCLAGLVSAAHGWPGACFSSMEILTVIYHRYIRNPLLPLNQRASIHLSKGHAAMAQYAILAQLGCFPVEKLTGYKQIMPAGAL